MWRFQQSLRSALPQDEPQAEDVPAGTHSRNASAGEVPYRDSEGEHGGEQRDKEPTESGEASGAPVLPEVSTVGSVELPSRVGSRRTQAASEHGAEEVFAGLHALTEASSPQSKNGPSQADHHLQPQSSPATTRLPFSGSSSPSRERGLSIASTTGSLTSSHRTGREGSRTERPSSMGYVAQHRTRDNIHEASPGEPSFTGSAAELVDELVHPDQ